MGLLFVESLPGPKVFRCKYCRVHSASPDAILSKDFRGRHGRAYLFDSVSLPGNNITGGIPEQFGNLSRLTSLDLEDNLFSVAVHRNLLRLIGFCTTQTERLLVYPFMQNLSVAYRLRGSM